MRSALSYPFSRMAKMSRSQALGAAPRPNRAENLGLMRRFLAIYSATWAPSGWESMER